MKVQEVGKHFLNKIQPCWFRYIISLQIAENYVDYATIFHE